MGMFNFFQTKSLHKVSRLDRIFVKAAQNKTYRSLFYKALMESELFILTTSIDKMPRGKFIHINDGLRSIKTLENGHVPLFTSKERIFDGNRSIEAPMGFCTKRARVIFELFEDKASFILNPFSELNKEILPDELKQLRANFFSRLDESTSIHGRWGILSRDWIDLSI